MNFVKVLLNLAASNVLIQSVLSAVASIEAGAAFTAPTAVITIGGKRYDVSLTVSEHKS
jgi:hypothetical protein